MSPKRINPLNVLANHKACTLIISHYNRTLREDGKLNRRKFYLEVILPEIPGYTESAWYSFLRKYGDDDGFLELPKPGVLAKPPAPVAITGEIVEGALGSDSPAVNPDGALAQVLLENKNAISDAINLALNISADALEEIRQDPSLVPARIRAEFFLKVMKAQDSRVKAVGTMRADNREQERFDRAQNSALYG